HPHSRGKFLAGEERASRGPSRARGKNDCGRFQSASVRQRIRRASGSGGGVWFRIYGILPADSATAGAARRPLAVSLAFGLDAGRGGNCGGAIAGSAFSSLSNRAGGPTDAETRLVIGP